MKTINMKHFAVTLLLLTLVVGFQNCSPVDSREFAQELTSSVDDLRVESLIGGNGGGSEGDCMWGCHANFLAAGRCSNGESVQASAHVYLNEADEKSPDDKAEVGVSLLRENCQNLNTGINLDTEKIVVRSKDVFELNGLVFTRREISPSL